MNLCTRCFLVTALVVLLSGCQSLESKFKPGKAADFRLFADQTIAVLGAAELDTVVDPALLLREYRDPDDPDEQNLKRLSREILRRFAIIVDYSLHVVDVNDLHSSEQEKIERYIAWFEPYRDELADQVGLTREQYEAIVADMRQLDDIRKALLAAQRLVNWFTARLNVLLQEVEATADVVEVKVAARIDAKYADVIRYQRALEGQRFATLNALELTHRISQREADAYAALRASNQILDPRLLPEASPDPDQLQAIVDVLARRLELLAGIAKNVQPDWNNYRAAHQELDTLRANLSADVSNARVLALVWSRAHLRMASGKSVAAEWFDIGASGSLLNQILKVAP